MTDWSLLAKGRGVPATDEEITKHGATLEPLESMVSTLIKQLPPETEPACVFQPDLGGKA